MSLVEFLLARIAEDEAAAKAADEYRSGAFLECDEAAEPFYWNADGTPRQPARVLAECEAKRRIVERLHRDGFDRSEWGEGQETAYCEVVRLLAVPYADHPDYDEEWKP